MIELRSDTFTLPTAAMREAMSFAAVGNDGYREDPTVLELEQRAADELGKAAACLTPSGIMANLAGLMTHLPRGGSLLVGDESDIYRHEHGGASICGGLVYHPVTTAPDGTLPLDALRAALAETAGEPRLICLENTQNRCGGKPLPLSYLDAVRELADEHGARVHVDGARLFNAAIATGVPAAELVRGADSAQFCLSKGLSAPIGSILAGDADFIAGARRVRTMLGGTMRQAGVIAAAGLVALDTMVDRLADDHRRARKLAEGLAGVPGLELDPAEVVTNIVLFDVTVGTAQDFIDAAARAGLAVLSPGGLKVRAVTHSGTTDADIAAAVAAAAVATADLVGAVR
ncbi:GntG family PLP-dependent aldolase [Amycolatopsis keratiniphila]|uniref:Threonine aldolase n=1 Tax=Amycolatopsis keratiniphila TaxID=129921 RepID=R4SZG2_9PSEU|nr:GntG family PLP-dependent aldolase [Amycolatopsis keratiniphila]AGM07915.1 threonine aldolase [Amycolatopsis keratiniphila]